MIQRSKFIKNLALVSLLILYSSNAFAGKGKGPVTGWVLYSLTKGTCYGVGAATLGAGAAAAGAGIPGTLASVTATLVTGGTGTTATLVSGAITTLGCTATAVEATTAVTMVGGGLAGAAAAVEALSLAAFSAGMACPFLP